MRISQLVKTIAEKEGLKKQVSVGNIREIVGIVSDVHFAQPQGIGNMLYQNGKRRARRKK